MPELFNNLCKGPVLVIDDRIGEGGDQIDDIIKALRDSDLYVISCSTTEQALNYMKKLSLTNFTILDWNLQGGADILEKGVVAGDAGREDLYDDNVEFIRKLREQSTAPVFILSKENPDEIRAQLKERGIDTGGHDSVFVARKSDVKEKNVLENQIEDWIKGSSHVYLAHWWNNAWQQAMTKVFWRMFDACPSWPSELFRAFESDGDDPVTSLRDTIAQLIMSDLEVSKLDSELIQPNGGDLSPEEFRHLYSSLVYTRNDIDSSIRPGDIYKKDEEYLLNLTPECDTTSRTTNPNLILVKGIPNTFRELSNRFEGGRLFERPAEIFALFLDGKDIVKFDKRKLFTKKENALSNEGFEKIVRVTSPVVSRWRQSFVSYLGRPGEPAYSKRFLSRLEGTLRGNEVTESQD